ncbi:hypothetical protein BR93DRAFT_940196 [Coniochaeta sp. PMI_546]|nr:hypothetical protein BR93DRAFT_940196 [Coniochaeta sp. PMI_546]
MRFHNNIAIALACTAWVVIPRTIASGVYAVAVINGTEDGDPIRLGDLAASAPPSLFLARNPHNLRKRWNKPDCYPFEGTQDLDHHTTDQTKAGIMAQCGAGHYVKPGYNYYSISGCVVSYFCHWKVSTRNYYDARCTEHDTVQSFAEIDRVCGAYKPGQRREVVLKDLNREGYDIAYGVESYCTSWGHNFCGMGV